MSCNNIEKLNEILRNSYSISPEGRRNYRREARQDHQNVQRKGQITNEAEKERGQAQASRNLWQWIEKEHLLQRRMKEAEGSPSNFDRYHTDMNLMSKLISISFEFFPAQITHSLLLLLIPFLFILIISSAYVFDFDLLTAKNGHEKNGHFWWWGNLKSTPYSEKLNKTWPNSYVFLLVEAFVI